MNDELWDRIGDCFASPFVEADFEDWDGRGEEDSA
jgi:hypothetical protein